MSIRIVVVEPQRLFRESFRALLRTQPDFEVVGDAGEAHAALSIAAASSPDVAVVETSVAAGADRSLLRELSRLGSPPRIVAMDSGSPRPLLIRPPTDGVAGIVCKDDPADEAFTAIRLTAAGRTYVTPRISALQPLQPEGEKPSILRSLTCREQEVFELVLRGDSTASIASKLSVSPRTVETHRAHVMRKLGVRSTVDLVRVAARNGLLAS
ncbi:MAG: response regulator transcription factor [Myxococcales bacterium]